MIAGTVKRWVKKITPKGVVRAYHRYLREAEHARNATRTPQQVFTEIYEQGTWGKDRNERFYSGTGSSTTSIVDPYVGAVSKYLASLPDQSRRVVDLGCGDFSVGRKLLPSCSSYIGVDVVPDLIRHLNATVSDPRTKFIHADIIDGDLPDADVCLIRQVFQHLSNAQISKVLAKLSKYQTVFITEHYPSAAGTVVPNKDKVHGGGIRLFDDSAVYVDQPPFNFYPSRMGLFLELPAHDFDDLFAPGVIRTFKFEIAERPQQGF